MIKVICDRAGLKGNFTNHSGKRTCATQLYIAGVDEQEIMARTRHRSEKSVRKYKQSCPETQDKIAGILDPPQPGYPSCSVSDNSRKRRHEDCENTVPSKNSKISVMDDSCDWDVSDEKVETACERSNLKDITNRPYFSNCSISINYK